MPRYHFNLLDHETVPDKCGTELPNNAIAQTEAVKFVGGYLQDHPELAWDGKEIRVEVRTTQKKLVFTILVLGIDGELN